MLEGKDLEKITRLGNRIADVVRERLSSVSYTHLSGPGSTNLVTGIATAYMDSVPVVAITCNYATSGLGRDSFQEVDICGRCV